MNDSNIKSDANGKGGPGSEWKRMNAVVTGLFTLLIIAGVPVIFRDYYFDILSFKYHFYCAVVILMAVVMLIVAIVYASKEKDQPGGRGMGEVMKGFSIKSLSAPDWAMICFFLAAAISTFQSEYFYESFWGNEGRYCGLFLIILYTVSFF